MYSTQYITELRTRIEGYGAGLVWSDDRMMTFVLLLVVHALYAVRSTTLYSGVRSDGELLELV